MEFSHENNLSSAFPQDKLNNWSFRAKKAWIYGLFRAKTTLNQRFLRIPMFKPVTVFDVSQTDGKPLPVLAETLVGDVQNYEVFMEAIKRSSPVPIIVEPMQQNMDGYFSLSEQNIHLREGMSEVQTVCAAIHEITHAKLHNADAEDQKSHKVEEIEALCSHYQNAQDYQNTS